MKSMFVATALVASLLASQVALGSSANEQEGRYEFLMVIPQKHIVLIKLGGQGPNTTNPEILGICLDRKTLRIEERLSESECPSSAKVGDLLEAANAMDARAGRVTQVIPIFSSPSDRTPLKIILKVRISPF